MCGLSAEEDSEDEEELEEDLEGREGEDVDTVGMVPMADMLNAKWGSENVRSIVLDLCVFALVRQLTWLLWCLRLSCSTPRRT